MTEKDWDAWAKCEDWRERAIRMFQAEQDQLRIEDGHNCRMIHVRGELVGAVDADTEVRLKFNRETYPALEFRRRGTNLFVFVYLTQWDRSEERVKTE